MNLKRLGTIAIAFLFAAPLRAEIAPLGSGDQLRLASLWSASTPSAPQTPHPAVVRVIATDRNSMSLGSGTLVDANDDYGLVISNWHVVRDAVGTDRSGVSRWFPFDGPRGADRSRMGFGGAIDLEAPRATGAGDDGGAAAGRNV